MSEKRGTPPCMAAMATTVTPASAMLPRSAQNAVAASSRSAFKARATPNEAPATKGVSRLRENSFRRRCDVLRSTRSGTGTWREA